MSLLKENSPQSELRVQDMGVTTVRSVMEKGTPHRTDLREGQAIYERMSEQSIYLYKVELEDGTVEMFGFSEPMDGERVNALLYFPAPSRTFGFDTNDILMDWEDLYKPENTSLLAGHRHIPNWGIFETERSIIRDSILSYRHAQSFPTEDVKFVPVIAWQSTAIGQFEWLIDASKVHGFEKVKATHLTKMISSPENKYSLLIGSLFAASYSPEITTAWEKKLTFELKKKEKNQREQNMGSTQALPLVLAWSEQLLDSQFVISLEENMGLGKEPRKPFTTRMSSELLLTDGLEEAETEEVSLQDQNGDFIALGIEGMEKMLYPSLSSLIKTKKISENPGAGFVPPMLGSGEKKIPDMGQTPSGDIFQHIVDTLPEADTFIFMNVYSELMLQGGPSDKIFQVPSEVDPKNWFKFIILALSAFKAEGIISDFIFTTWMNVVLYYMAEHKTSL